MRRRSYLILTGTIVAVLLILSTATAQYRNSATGATFNNSFSAMLDMTRTWNQNLWNAQKAVQQVDDATARIANASPSSSSTPSSVVPSTPPALLMAPPVMASPQYPMTATDFQPLRGRLLPDQ